jgi:nucleoside 2-deoxyribosyltransferase
MAFDREDTENLYEKSIRPVLKKNSIIPLIINRREDNRDINHQIVELLDACDFAIADLTYTRPSVYFEAGYAQREVEVIYTVRSDHLKQGQPDDRRVHFDLQMKPIIKWKTADNKSFRKSLEQRLQKTVLREFIRGLAIREKERIQKDEFAHMPLTDRLLILRGEALRGLYRFGFNYWHILDRWVKSRPLPYRQKLADLKKRYWLMSTVRQKRLMRLVSLRVEESLTLKKLRDEVNANFISSRYPPHLSAIDMAKERFPINKTVEHHVLCSLKVLPKTRIMSSIPSLRWEPELNCYMVELPWVCKETKWRGNKHKDVLFSVERYAHVHFIDNIQSIAEFKTRLAMVLQNIQATQNEAKRKRKADKH